MAVVARRKRNRSGAGWTWRLGGLVLCLFFGLGFLSGLGAPRSAFATRTLSAVDNWRQALREEAALARRLPIARRERTAPRTRPAGAIALVERHDGFYALFASGELRGPISPDSEDNLPIISGPPADGATAEDLVEYASVIVRAEAQLSVLISEMKLEPDGEAALFLDRGHTELVLDLDQATLELERAALVMSRWRGREALVASLDMTTPDEAVMRLRAAKPSVVRRPAASATRVATRGGREQRTHRLSIAKVAEASLR